MKNQSPTVLRTAAFALACAAALAVTHVHAGDFVPPINGTNWDDDTNPEPAERPATIAPANPDVYPSVGPRIESTESDATCTYDLNDDGFVDFDDFLQLLSAGSTSPDASTGAAYDFSDLVGILSAWGSC